MLKNLQSPELWRTVRFGMEIGNLMVMMMMMAANSAGWGGDRDYDDGDDGGEQCEVG